MTEDRRVACAIAGGGPAGLMLGYLLARAGVSVLVLEKHADFLRDFRGDTIHPSTLQIMQELGLLERFLALPHQKVERLTANFGGTPITLADFSTLPTAARFIAMMPQWDFLNFLASEGAHFPSFSIRMKAEAAEFIEEGGKVVGVLARTGNGPLRIKADLVVGADGRSSTLRERSRLETVDIGAPMDALWFRLPRHATDTDQTQGRFDPGRVFVMLNRGDYWQCAFVIPKGSFEATKADGLPAFQRSVGALVPFEPERGHEIRSWDEVKLLNVKVDRLVQWWKPGLLFIGDAAHAMSPVGGVGVNLAVQDAVAAANRLAQPLLNGRVSAADLAAVQKRREFPTRMTQRLQVGIQNTLIASALDPDTPLKAPLVMRLIAGSPLLRRIPSRLLGLGVRPEHVAPFLRA